MNLGPRSGVWSVDRTTHLGLRFPYPACLTLLLSSKPPLTRDCIYPIFGPNGACNYAVALEWRRKQEVKRKLKIMKSLFVGV